MSIMQIVVVGLISTALAVTVKKHSPEIALMIAIIASALLFFMTLPLLAEVMGVIRNIGDLLDSNIKYVSLVLKVIGIAYVAELGAQACADAGEGAIASKVEMGGKVIILALALPVLLDLVNMVMGIMP